MLSLDLNDWARVEFTREIGRDPGTLEALRILGIHWNTKSNAIDILGFVRSPLDAESLAESLLLHHILKNEESIAKSLGKPWAHPEWETRRKGLIAQFRLTWELHASSHAPEVEVADTLNFFVEFTPSAIAAFLSRHTSSLSTLQEVGPILPEALAVILGAARIEWGDEVLAQFASRDV